MPAMIKILTPDGLHDAPYKADSLEDAARHEPTDGVYTVTNTYNTVYALKLDAHLDRLEDSARRAGIDLQLNRQRLRHALRQMIDAANYGDVRFRVTVPGQQPDHLILTLEPFAPPSTAIKRDGVRVITAANSARQNAQAKTTDWMHARKRLKAAQPVDVYETLLMDANGAILEGLSSNFYAILNDALHTAGEGILHGISRQVVFAIAPPIVPLHEMPITHSDLPNVQEAFLTSSSRGIIPIVQIDDVVIGQPDARPYTQRLMAAYDAWVEAHLEIIA